MGKKEVPNKKKCPNGPRDNPKPIFIFRFKPYGKDNNKFARQPGEDGGERTVWAV